MYLTQPAPYSHPHDRHRRYVIAPQRNSVSAADYHAATPVVEMHREEKDCVPSWMLDEPDDFDDDSLSDVASVADSLTYSTDSEFDFDFDICENADEEFCSSSSTASSVDAEESELVSLFYRQTLVWIL